MGVNLTAVWQQLLVAFKPTHLLAPIISEPLISCPATTAQQESKLQCLESRDTLLTLRPLWSTPPDHLQAVIEQHTPVHCHRGSKGDGDGVQHHQWTSNPVLLSIILNHVQSLTPKMDKLCIHKRSCSECRLASPKSPGFPPRPGWFYVGDNHSDVCETMYVAPT